MIRTFKNKRLERFFRTKSGRYLPPDKLETIKNILGTLNVINDIEELRVSKRWRLYRLHGELAEFWSVSVSGNWRIVFRLIDGDIYDIDLVDYH